MKVNDQLYQEPFYNNSSHDPDVSQIMNYKIESSFLSKTNFSFLKKCFDTQEKKIKIIKFIKFFKSSVEDIKNEIDLMRIVQHPNIIKCEDYFRQGPYMCIILPYTRHKSIFTLICQVYRSGMPESLAVPMMYQMLQAVNYLHNMYICHRDIKPDNFLIFDPPNPRDGKIIKLTDFGFASSLSDGKKFKGTYGTDFYMAPEILSKKSYDQSVDIWSLGVTFYIMLVGTLPIQKFLHNRDAGKQNIVKNGIDLSLLSKNSIEVRDLIERMCKLDPDERITANDASKNPWILRQIHGDDKSEIEKSIEQYINKSFDYDFTPKT